MQGPGQAGGGGEGEAEAGEEEGGEEEQGGIQRAAAGGPAGWLHQAQDALEGARLRLAPP